MQFSSVTCCTAVKLRCPNPTGVPTWLERNTVLVSIYILCVWMWYTHNMCISQIVCTLNWTICCFNQLKMSGPIFISFFFCPVVGAEDCQGGFVIDRLHQVKLKVYKNVVWLDLMCSLEAPAKWQKAELKVAELKLLRFSLGVTRIDKIKNRSISGTDQCELFGDKVREARMGYFGHVEG